ncbi:MAG: hypothetical protein AB1509_15825 [Chloroflexota bacterium]
MKNKLLHWSAILLILATGFLHYITAAEEYSQARYMGLLFIANFLGSLAAAFGIARRRLGWGWMLGGVIAAGSILGYIQSRTLGMPGMDVEAWYDPIGIPALIVETLFLVTLLLARPWDSLRDRAEAPAPARAAQPSVYRTAAGLLGGLGLFVLIQVTQVYQAGKDVCGLTFAHPEVLFQSPTGLKVFFIGSLFFVIFLLSCLAAYGVWRRRFWAGWAVGLFAVAALLFGIYQSRIAGVPEIAILEWNAPAGIASLLGMGFLIVFFWSNAWALGLEELSPMLQDKSRQPVFILSVALVIVSVGFISYQLGAVNNHVEHPLPETVLSNDMLEQEYGIRLTLVGVTAAGGMVDVRYRVVDPLKAAKLIDEEEGGIMPMVYVNNGDVMLMPDMHMREQKLVAGRVYFVLIPNSQNVVKRGTVVTVVFGDVAVEPTLAQ